jgi:hypothetical protein
MKGNNMLDKSPRLFCLMREDIPDLNPGKACAQAMHAQAIFDDFMKSFYINKVFDSMGMGNKNTPDNYYDFYDQYFTWTQEAGQYGTTIVLSATMDDIKKIKDAVIVTDPTYPWRNYEGKLFTSNTVTCAFYFRSSFSKEEDLEVINNLKLYN